MNGLKRKERVNGPDGTVERKGGLYRNGRRETKGRGT